MSSIPSDVVKDLAPGGTLRVAINLGNPVLAQKDAGTGTLGGVSVELARELARRAGVPIQLTEYEAAGKVFDALKSGAWDLAFLAIEPVRAAEIDFTPPYVIIEGTYMVRKDSPLKAIEDVDRPGIRIAVGKGAAYDLYLTRTLKHATLVRSHTGGGAAPVELFLEQNLDVAAGVKQALVAHARTDQNVRIMDGHFMEIRQAMGTPKGRDKAAAFLKTYIEEMKASGFVADALKRSNQPDAAVAPPAS
jgi:polar amino acid transport system substrate-binding protein